MAVPTHLFPLLISLLFILSCSPVFSRTTPSSTTTTATATLDVSASHDLVTGALSFDLSRAQQTLDPEKAKLHSGNSSSSDLSLTLHSRDFLSTTPHKNYKTLTLARLSRDSARVSAITARAALAVNGISRSDLKPLLDPAMTTTATGDDLQGPIVSGTSQGSGEYFSRVGVGRPAKPLFLVVDTGSDVTWIQCEPCAECYQQTGDIFNPSLSSTYSPLSCDSETCRALDVSACRNSSCLYQVSYGDGSYTLGDFATETISFSDSSPVSGVAIGCGHDNEGLFVGAAGLLGLGGGSLSFPSQVSAHAFSYCLVDRDSSATSTLQFGPSAAPDAGAVTAPLLQNHKMDTFYYVSMTGISVGGELLSIPPSSFAMDETGAGGVIVDSGTAVTRLQTDAYTALRDAFTKRTGDLPATSGVALFDTCYDLSSKTTAQVPTVSFHFPGGSELKLPAKNYLIPVDSAGTFCLAFAATTAPLSIIGNVQQQGTRVSFDLENSLVGFSPNKC
ncbi:putative nepenthesin [Dioscorea sansibarensis]